MDLKILKENTASMMMRAIRSILMTKNKKNKMSEELLEPFSPRTSNKR